MYKYDQGCLFSEDNFILVIISKQIERNHSWIRKLEKSKWFLSIVWDMTNNIISSEIKPPLKSYLIDEIASASWKRSVLCWSKDNWCNFHEQSPWSVRYNHLDDNSWDLFHLGLRIADRQVCWQSAYCAIWDKIEQDMTEIDKIEQEYTG